MSASALNGCAAYLLWRALRRAAVLSARADWRDRAVAWRCSDDVSVVVLTIVVTCPSLVPVGAVVVSGSGTC